MLHSQTLMMLAIVLQVLLPLLVLWTTVASQYRQAVQHWCGGAVLVGVGMVLIVLRPWLPTWVTFHLGNTLLIIGWVLQAQALRHLLGRPWSGLLIGVWCLGAWGVYSTLYAQLEAPQRVMGMRWVMSGLYLYGAWLAWQLVRRWRSFNAVAIAVCCSVLALGMLAQILHLLFQQPESWVQPYLVHPDRLAGVMALLILISVAVLNLCFAALIAEWAARDSVQAQQALVAAEETDRLQAALRQNERHQRLVMVTGTLAHELNQPLTVVLQLSELAEHLVRTGPIDAAMLTALFDELQAAIERTDAILERVRQAARDEPMAMQRLDLCPLVRDAVHQLRHDARQQGVTVHDHLPEGPLWVMGNALALSQVLVNLVRNALQAMAASARRELHLACSTGPAPRQCGAADTAEGKPPDPRPWLFLRLRDSGPGVPAELLAHWGQPFMSTRREGLGLGVAICRAIVEQHGGQLLLQNHPEGGAQAELQLPLQGPQVEARS